MGRTQNDGAAPPAFPPALALAVGRPAASAPPRLRAPKKLGGPRGPKQLAHESSPAPRGVQIYE